MGERRHLAPVFCRARQAVIRQRPEQYFFDRRSASSRAPQHRQCVTLSGLSAGAAFLRWATVQALASIIRCSRPRRIAVAEAAQKRDPAQKTAGHLANVGLRVSRSNLDH
jgi:hypothetical protein